RSTRPWHYCPESVRCCRTASAKARSRTPPGPCRREDRQRRSHCCRGANCEQDSDLDGRCYAFPRWKMVRGGDRSRRSRAYPTRSSSSKSSGNFRDRRYGVARSGRKTAGGSCSGCNATRTLRWQTDSAPTCRQEGAKAVSLFRQRHHGRRRQGLRSSAERENSSARSHCVAGVGFHSHHVSVSAQSENQRAPAMGLVVPDRTTWGAVDRELSAI